MPGRIVDRIDKQHVIAGRQEGEKRNGNSGKTGRDADRTCRTFQRINGSAKRIAGRRATRAISVFLATGCHRLCIREKHG